jgi:hypothetical protein
MEGDDWAKDFDIKDLSSPQGIEALISLPTNAAPTSTIQLVGIFVDQDIEDWGDAFELGGGHNEAGVPTSSQRRQSSTVNASSSTVIKDDTTLKVTSSSTVAPKGATSPGELQRDAPSPSTPEDERVVNDVIRGLSGKSESPAFKKSKFYKTIHNADIIKKGKVKELISRFGASKSVGSRESTNNTTPALKGVVNSATLKMKEMLKELDDDKGSKDNSKMMKLLSPKGRNAPLAVSVSTNELPSLTSLSQKMNGEVFSKQTTSIDNKTTNSSNTTCNPQSIHTRDEEDWGESFQQDNKMTLSIAGKVKPPSATIANEDAEDWDNEFIDTSISSSINISPIISRPNNIILEKEEGVEVGDEDWDAELGIESPISNLVPDITPGAPAPNPHSSTSSSEERSIFAAQLADFRKLVHEGYRADAEGPENLFNSVPPAFKLLKSSRNANVTIKRYPKPCTLYSLKSPEAMKLQGEASALETWLMDLVNYRKSVWLKGQGQVVNPMHSSQVAGMKVGSTEWCKASMQGVWSLYRHESYEVAWASLLNFFGGTFICLYSFHYILFIFFLNVQTH